MAKLKSDPHRSELYLCELIVPVVPEVVFRDSIPALEDLPPGSLAEDEYGLDPGWPRWLIFSNAPTNRRTYSPFAEAALLTKFDSLAETPDAILKFAKRFGPLLHPASISESGEPAIVGGLLAESLQGWRRRMRYFRFLRRIQQAVLKKDEEMLAKYIKWGRDGRSVYLCNGTSILNYDSDDGYFIQSILASSTVNPWALLVLKPPDVTMPAQLFLQKEVNKTLHEHAHPTLTLFGRPDIVMIPDCLWSAMVVMLAFELAGRKGSPVQCEYCKRFFYPARSTKRFCDQNCRQLARYHSRPPLNRASRLSTGSSADICAPT